MSLFELEKNSTRVYLICLRYRQSVDGCNLDICFDKKIPSDYFSILFEDLCLNFTSSEQDCLFSAKDVDESQLLSTLSTLRNGGWRIIGSNAYVVHIINTTILKEFYFEKSLDIGQAVRGTMNVIESATTYVPELNNATMTSESSESISLVIFLYS